MPYLTKADLRNFRSNNIQFNESISNKSYKTSFDVFLSHSYADKERVEEVKGILEGKGKSVYVDWIEDIELDRKDVTVDSARILRKRMSQCNEMYLLYLKENYVKGQWCSWEVGYFDSLKNSKVFILPILEDENDYHSHEYLKLYEEITIVNPQLKNGNSKEIQKVTQAQQIISLIKSFKI